MINSMEVPGLYGGKDLFGRYLYLSNDFAPMVGYKSANDFMRHERTDYDLKCSAVELAPVLIKEDKKVILTKKPIKMISFACFLNDDWRLMHAEKRPIYKDNEIYGVANIYIEINKSHIQPFLLSICENETSYFRVKKNQFSYYLKENHDEKIFSRRESECLFFIIRGYSNREVGDRLGIGNRTVEVYIDNLKDKLECNKKREVIEKALSLGYYNIIPNSLMKRI